MFALQPVRCGNTGFTGDAVYDHGTGAACPLAAAVLNGGHMQLIPEESEQGLLFIRFHRFTIYYKCIHFQISPSFFECFPPVRLEFFHTGSQSFPKAASIAPLPIFLALSDMVTQYSFFSRASISPILSPFSTCTPSWSMPRTMPDICA